MARVLHIEDDPRNRLLVRKLLSAEGHEVIDAADGLEGVRLALEHRPDLVLVDLNIPGLDGYEVTLRLRSDASLNGVPIVAITAEGERDTSFAVGCDGFLQKPIDARAFPRRVREFLDGRRDGEAPGVWGERLRVQSARIVGHLEAKVAELSAANDRLRDMDRLRTEFYRNISHELATPLTPIVGYVRMMLDEELGEISRPQQKALRSMDDCVRRLRVTLDNLVDVMGLETGRMTFVNRDYDFAEAVRRSLTESEEGFAARTIRLVDDVPRDRLSGYGDAERLGRAVHQILSNALKFTPPGGQIGISVREHGATYELAVADSGPGIPASRMEQIFEPFYQVDGSSTRAHGGVGVGLAIARRIARGLGGDVRVEQGGEVAGVAFSGAVFVLSVAKRAPTVVLDSHP